MILCVSAYFSKVPRPLGRCEFCLRTASASWQIELVMIDSTDSAGQQSISKCALCWARSTHANDKLRVMELDTVGSLWQKVHHGHLVSLFQVAWWRRSSEDLAEQTKESSICWLNTELVSYVCHVYEMNDDLDLGWYSVDAVGINDNKCNNCINNSCQNVSREFKFEKQIRIHVPSKKHFLFTLWIALISEPNSV